MPATNGLHPLQGVSLSVRRFKCFGEDGGGFTDFQPINVIIRRNNTGKSALIDVVELCISSGGSYDDRKHAWQNFPFDVLVSQCLDEQSLRAVFKENLSGGGIPGNNHWTFGCQFVGHDLCRNYGPGWTPRIESGPDFSAIPTANREKYLADLASTATWPFQDLILLRVAAERDVRQENRETKLTLAPNGTGTTNLIRAVINSEDLPREEVERGLLEDLNEVYRGDSEFSQIICQEDNNGLWELFLREEKKGNIRLSQSGSSLRSIFFILSMLRLRSFVAKIDWTKVVLAIEEPENNLHPALMRRLLNFLADIRDEKAFTLLITTHSPIGIDWSAGRSDSQIIHVQHDGQAATSHTAIGYRAGRDILDDLDVRAADILQANGIIWVEGPSDRIYIRRWLDLVSNGRLKETVHYAIMFYAGKLLSHVNVLPPDEEDALISLLLINRNAAVVIDSDRHLGTPSGRKPRARLNNTKLRIKDEVANIGGFVWVTEGREVENYTPIEVYARVVGKRAPRVDKYAQIAKLPLLREFKTNKVAIAHAVAPETREADLIGHLDIWSRLNELCTRIDRWNGIRAPE